MHPEIRTPKYVIELARKMRFNMTITEEKLWAELKEKKIAGFKFRKQHPIFRYILDFYCHEKLLAIEIDGPVHESRLDYDEYRDQYLQGLGIETLRFSNDQILNSLDEVLKKILEKLSTKY